MIITSDSRFSPGGEFYDNDPNDPTYDGDGRYGTGLEYMTSSNPMYDAYYKANPYVGQTYKKTLIDKLFGGIFRTGYDKWRDEMSVNAAQYNAGIVDMQQQNQYNSEEAKAMRMRAAGENPDLLGTGDVSDAASTNPDPQDAMIPDTDDVAGAFGAVTNFISGFREIFSGAVAMMKTFQDINLDKIKGDSEIAGLAQDDLFRTIPASGFANQDEFDAWFDSKNLLTLSDKDAEFYRSSHNIPRQYWKRYRDAFVAARSNLPTELKYYQDATARAGLRKQLAMLTGSRYYSEGIDELDAVIEPLVQLQDDVTKLQANIAKLTAQNQQRYQGDIVPEVLENQDLALDVERKEISNASINADIQGDYLEGLQSSGYGVEMSAATMAQIQIGKLVAQTQQKIIQKLKDLADDGSHFAKCLQYQMVLSQFYNFNPINILTGAFSSGESTSQRASTAAMLAKMFM